MSGQRRRCEYVIDSLRNDRRRGKANRPWWERQCRRMAVPGERFCWQHLPHNTQPDKATEALHFDGYPATVGDE